MTHEFASEESVEMRRGEVSVRRSWREQTRNVEDIDSTIGAAMHLNVCRTVQLLLLVQPNPVPARTSRHQQPNSKKVSRGKSGAYSFKCSNFPIDSIRETMSASSFCTVTPASRLDDNS